MTATPPIRVAVPSKGRLRDVVLDLLTTAGYGVSGLRGRGSIVRRDGMELIEMRPRDAAAALAAGTLDGAFIATDMTDAMMKKRAAQRGTDMQEAIASFLRTERPHLVLQRRGRAEEVGFIVACLLSERASFVNGANYRIDGGSVQSVNI